MNSVSAREWAGLIEPTATKGFDDVIRMNEPVSGLFSSKVEAIQIDECERQGKGRKSWRQNIFFLFYFEKADMV